VLLVAPRRRIKPAHDLRHALNYELCETEARTAYIHLDLVARRQRGRRAGVDVPERTMNVQPQWPSFSPLAKTVSRHWAPHERLAELRADLSETKARVRLLLEAVAVKYDIPAKDVSYAIDGYANDVLSDLVFGIKRNLDHGAEAEASRDPHSGHDGTTRAAAAGLSVGTEPASICRPMSEFDPSEPALVHDLRHDRMLPWSRVRTNTRDHSVFAPCGKHA
jgi:hypothetical protein